METVVPASRLLSMAFRLTIVYESFETAIDRKLIDWIFLFSSLRGKKTKDCL